MPVHFRHGSAETRDRARAYGARMTSFSGFDPAALDFLRDLRDHNDRAWFEAHRADYEERLLLPARELVIALGERLAAIAPGIRADPRVNGSILRINRDTRFSNDKRPYKTHLDLWLWEGDGPSRGCSGFFLRIEADSVGYGAGMHHFEKDTLAAYRGAVDDPRRGAALTRAVKQATASGAQVGRERWKRVPAPYAADHPRAEYLRYGGMVAGTREEIPAELFTATFPAWCVERFRTLRPLQKWVAQVVAAAAR
jgi:uncharacterized protein (TIGR02453 family)